MIVMMEAPLIWSTATTLCGATSQETAIFIVFHLPRLCLQPRNFILPAGNMPCLSEAKQKAEKSGLHPVLSTQFHRNLKRSRRCTVGLRERMWARKKSVHNKGTVGWKWAGHRAVRWTAESLRSFASFHAVYQRHIICIMSISCAQLTLCANGWSCDETKGWKNKVIKL
jgi:hypothetical protein